MDRILKINTNLSPVLLNNDLEKKVKFVESSFEWFGVDQLFPKSANDLRKKLRPIFEEKFSKIAHDSYVKAEYPDAAWAIIRELDIVKYIFDGPDHSWKYACVIIELARIDASLCTMYLVHTALFMHTFNNYASDELKKEYMPKITNCDLIGSWGLTEPEFGSDASGLQMSAHKKEDGSWVLNGKKKWPGNANRELMTVFARCTKDKKVKCFLVHLDWPGITRKLIKGKFSQRSVHNMEIDFNDVVVTEKYRLIKINKFSDVKKLLFFSRLSVSWIACGLGMGIYDNMISYLSNRYQFNHPLTRFQLIQEKIVKVMADIQSSLLLTCQAQKLLNQGEARMGQISIAKGFSTLYIRNAASLARESFGGNGIILDYKVMKSYQDIESLYTYEGTFDINLLVTGRELTGINAIIP